MLGTHLGLLSFDEELLELAPEESDLLLRDLHFLLEVAVLRSQVLVDKLGQHRGRRSRI